MRERGISFYNKKVVMPDGTIEVIPDLIEFNKEKLPNLIFISFPAAFTPICASEMKEYSSLVEEFEKVGTQIVAFSGDSIETLKRWLDPKVENSIGRLNFPVMSLREASILNYRTTMAVDRLNDTSIFQNLVHLEMARNPANDLLMLKEYVYYLQSGNKCTGEERKQIENGEIEIEY